MLRSIRSRTLVLVLGVLTLSLSLISWRSYRDAQHEIEELFDARLAQSARLLEGMAGSDLSPTSLAAVQQALDVALIASADDEQHPEQVDGHRYESKLAFQILDDRQHVLLQSAGAPVILLPRLLQQLAASPLRQAVLEGREPLSSLDGQLVGYHDVPVWEHENWRIFVHRDRTRLYWILVAEREDVRGELVGSITLRSLLPDLLGLPLLALLVWLAIGFGLRPLHQVASLIKSRDPENLAALELAPLPPELEPMVGALNRLLLQVDHLLEREKRFIADAAHELRTPLAVLRIHAENALQLPDPADREAALRQLVSGVERATRVVNQMLTLARLEPQVLHSRMQRLDLGPYVRDELAGLIPLALERGIELECELADGADLQLVGDAGSFGILLQNLVGNAVQYTPPGGRIQVCLQGLGDRVLLQVGDSGPGVPAGQRSQLFRRFHRQTSAGQGAGLGLAIVQRIVELHHGSIELGTAALGGLQVQVSLPRSQPTQAGSVAH